MRLAVELAGAFAAGLVCALVGVLLALRWLARHPEELMRRLIKRAAKGQQQTSTGGDGSIEITRK